MKNASFFHVYLFILSGALFSCVTPEPADESSTSSESVSSVEQTGSSSSAGAYTVKPKGGYTALTSDVEGLLNYQSVEINWSEFDKQQSLTVFENTLYPHLLASGCAGCHSRESRGQAPLHADGNTALAHEYALTKVFFKNPAQSRFVERLKIDRHNCPGTSCAEAAEEMLSAVESWISQIEAMLPVTPRGVPAEVQLSESQIEQWIENDKQQISDDERPYYVYTSLHELHNEGLSADELNIVRVAVSKALNSTARWAPDLVNPVDVTGQGILYRFDIRDYWGYNQGVERLLYGGAEETVLSGQLDYLGEAVKQSIMDEQYNFTGITTEDPAHALRIWQRVLHGNIEGQGIRDRVDGDANNIDGFKGPRSVNPAGAFVTRTDLKWVEASQLVYTLTRPDVYNAVMMNPMAAVELEQNLGVDNSQGVNSYEYLLTADAITVDSRMLYRANRPNGGWYWKTWDVFTRAWSREERFNIYDVYADPEGKNIHYPFWANPIPKFVSSELPDGDDPDFSFIANLAQSSSTFSFGTSADAPGCDYVEYAGAGFGFCRHYTGTGGLQQSASEIIYNLSNGLQGYYLTGTYNQRRLFAATDVVRDPRRMLNQGDDIAFLTGFYQGVDTEDEGSANDNESGRLLIVGSSCIGCHADGMNRVNNDLRHWVDNTPDRLPRGPYGVDGWINDQQTVARVRELYKPNADWKATVEADRELFLQVMAKIKHGMVLGEDKNIYVEPVIWTVEHVQRVKYGYPEKAVN